MSFVPNFLAPDAPPNTVIGQLLSEEEGRVNHAYQDSMGYWTYGVGHLIDPRKGGTVSDAIIDAQLLEDIQAKSSQAALLTGFAALNEVQKAAVISMVFQLGLGGVRGFPTFCEALAHNDLAAAAAAGLDSKWAKHDTPARAQREVWV